MRHFPESFCINGAVAFPGPDSTMRLAKGYALSHEDLRAGTNRAKNRFSSAWEHGLKFLTENGAMQVHFVKSNAGNKDAIQHASSFVPAKGLEAERVRHAAQLSKLISQGQLQREYVSIWFGDSIRIRSKEKKMSIEGMSSSFDELESCVSNQAKLIEGALTPVGASLTELSDEEIVSLWRTVLSPESKKSDEGIKLPIESGFSLTEFCISSELRGGRRGFFLDGNHFAIFALKRLPFECYPGIMDHLAALPLKEFVITALVKRIPKENIIRSLQQRLSRLSAQMKRRTDPELKPTFEQISLKIDRLARGVVAPLTLEVVVALHAKTEEALSKQCEILRSATARMNNAELFEATVSASARNLFLKTLPGNLWSPDRGFEHYTESSYAPDLLPISKSFCAHIDQPEALFTGLYGNLVGARTFLGEGEISTPQHAIFCGGSGGGKSFFLGKFLSQVVNDGDWTCIVEEGLSQASFTEALGAKPIVLVPGGAISLNPFDTSSLPFGSLNLAIIVALVSKMLGIPSDEEKRRSSKALLTRHVNALMTEVAEDWFRLQPESERAKIIRHAYAAHRIAGELLTDDVEAFLFLKHLSSEESGKAAEELGRATSEELNLFLSKHRDSVLRMTFAFGCKPPILSSLCEHLEVSAVSDGEAAKNAASSLRLWCRGGTYGTLFDNQSNVSFKGPVIHFELGRIPKGAEELKSVFLFLLVNLIRQHVLTLPKPVRKRFAIDEIQPFLAIPEADEFLKEASAQFRKFNCQLIVTCQQLSQFGSEVTRSVVLGNASMAFLFHPGDLSDLDIASKYLPLSESAKAMIGRYSRPDQLKGKIFSECCYLHKTAREPYCGTIRITA